MLVFNLLRRHVALVLLVFVLAAGAGTVLIAGAPGTVSGASAGVSRAAHQQINGLQREILRLDRRVEDLQVQIKHLRANVRELQKSKRAWIRWGRHWRNVARHGVTGRAATVVRLARPQLGKPYVFGAAGPWAFDCSGLVKYVFGKVGVHLSHGATYQQRASRRISLSALRAGDLVFYGGAYRSYHVAIYVGGGRTIEATDGRVRYGWVGHAWTGGTFFH